MDSAATPGALSSGVHTTPYASPAELADNVLQRWMSAMRRGDFEAAWCETDRIEIHRRRSVAAGRDGRQPYHLLWDGTPFEGRDVVIRCNHGLGDTLQFLRFVPALARRARSITTLVQPPLVGVLRDASGVGHIRDGWQDQPLVSSRVEIEVMELAYALRITLDKLPPPIEFRIDRLRERTGALAPHVSGKKRRIGLLWSSGDWDPTRSIPLDVLAPLGTLRDLDFFSLQQGSAATTVTGAPFCIHPLHRHTGDIADAAAAMLALDLVITVDGMAAHLAGALRRPAWVLLKHDADWRWLTDRCDSPWYPTMRLFRQRRPGDWQGLTYRLAEALRELPRP
jgi:hypothetical protein